MANREQILESGPVFDGFELPCNRSARGRWGGLSGPRHRARSAVAIKLIRRGCTIPSRNSACC